MARKSTPKVDDVYLKLDKEDVETPVSEHPTVSSKAKEKIQENNTKAAKDVAESQSSTNIITSNPDYNSTGDDFENDEGTYVKKLNDSNPNDISNSTYKEYFDEKKEKQETLTNKFNYELTTGDNGEIIKSKIDQTPETINKNIPDKTYIVSDNSTIKITTVGTKQQAVATRPNQTTLKGELSFTKSEEELVNDMLTILTNEDNKENKYTIIKSYKDNKKENPNIIDVRTYKNSPYGPFTDITYELIVDINAIKFENIKGDTKVEIYNGQGEKLGFRPLISNNKFNKPIVQDFYAGLARLSSAASLEGVNINLIRGYQSYEEQIEIRRKYAPVSQKSNDNWLETVEPDSGFKNENGDKIKVNKPGYGYHIFGNTFDIDVKNPKVYEWLVKYAHNYGFYRTIPHEIWHWEYKPWLFRLGGIENPSNKPLSDSVGGWKNELWQKLYTKLTDAQDPLGPKFLPNEHSSWLGFKGEIKGNTVNNIPPFISTEDSGSTLNFADLVAETPPGSGGGIPDDDKQLIARLRQIFKEKGYKWFDEILQLNIIGVRSAGNLIGTTVEKYGQFNDFLYCIYKDKNNNQIVKKYNITTEPGKEILDPKSSLYRQGGAAILVPNQYDVYKLGFHGNATSGPAAPYLAFWQLRGNVEVARDSKGDEKYDYDINKQSGPFGINIHRSGFGVTQRIVNWSEGCQVFSSFNQWQEFIEIARRSAEQQGISYSRIIQAEKTPPAQLLEGRPGSRLIDRPDYQFGNFTYTLLREEDF